MRIQVDIDNGRIRRALRLLVTHHARQTLRRLRELLPRINVTVSQVTEAGGGLTKRCVVEMTAGKSQPVVMASTAKTWQDAIKLALRQASERLTALVRGEQAEAKAQRRLGVMRRPLLR